MSDATVAQSLEESTTPIPVAKLDYCNGHTRGESVPQRKFPFPAQRRPLWGERVKKPTNLETRRFALSIYSSESCAMRRPRRGARSITWASLCARFGGFWPASPARKAEATLRPERLPFAFSASLGGATDSRVARTSRLDRVLTQVVEFRLNLRNARELDVQRFFLFAREPLETFHPNVQIRDTFTCGRRQLTRHMNRLDLEGPKYCLVNRRR